MKYSTMPLDEFMLIVNKNTYRDAGLTQRLVRELRNALANIEDLAAQIGELQRRLSDIQGGQREVQLGMCVGLLRTCRRVCINAGNDTLLGMIDRLLKEVEAV